MHINAKSTGNFIYEIPSTHTHTHDKHVTCANVRDPFNTFEMHTAAGTILGSLAGNENRKRK